MDRSVLKGICAGSGIVFLALCAVFFSGALRAFQSAPTGIIGGADLPTLAFLLEQLFRTPLGMAAVAAFLVFCGSGLMLIFRRR